VRDGRTTPDKVVTTIATTAPTGHAPATLSVVTDSTQIPAWTSKPQARAKSKREERSKEVEKENDFLSLV
jgi:hypothetical protein